MLWLATKTADQLDLQALHRVRERLVRQRTGIINQTCWSAGSRIAEIIRRHQSMRPRTKRLQR